jgi:hypothetical protein
MSYVLALKREHLALQKMKILTFFLFFGVIFALLDPHTNCGSGSMRIRIRIRNPGYTCNADLLPERCIMFYVLAVLRIRIHVFFGHLDPDPDPLVRCMDPDPDPDPSIIKRK